MMKKVAVFGALLALAFLGASFEAVKNEPALSLQQETWNRAYGGADKSYDTNLLKMRELIAPLFQTLKYDDVLTGKTMTYSLYIPRNYDPAIKYPLVLFMADGSTTGKGPESPLKQGYGGIIWATAESQEKNPCFVLVPSYEGPQNTVNDNWEVTYEVDMTLRLLQDVISRYSIDKKRLYTTGQSMGGMMSFYFNANHPGLFAASIYVGSQWDVNVLEPLAGTKFFYIVSAGDPKASAGMNSLGNMFKEKGVVFGTTEFSARLPRDEQENQILSLLEKGNNINFVQFTKGTVVPENSSSKGGEHMYSFDYAYQLESVRDWLFRQSGD